MYDINEMIMIPKLPFFADSVFFAVTAPSPYTILHTRTHTHTQTFGLSIFFVFYCVFFCFILFFLTWLDDHGGTTKRGVYEYGGNGPCDEGTLCARCGSVRDVCIDQNPRLSTIVLDRSIAPN